MNNEYLIQKETLTGLADEIRVLSGATDAIGLAAMKTNIADANTEVNSQATTIAEIAELLNGKSVPGGDSSGGAVETCEVHADGCHYVFYTGVENDQPVAKESVGNDKYASHSVIACGNSMIVCADLQSNVYALLTGADLVRGNNTYYVAVKMDQGAKNVVMNFTGSGGGTND